MDSNGAAGTRGFVAYDGQTAGGAVADLAGIAQQRQAFNRSLFFGTVVGCWLAGRSNGQQFKWQVPEQPIGHDDQLLDADPQLDFGLLEEQSLHSLGRWMPVCFKQTLSGYRRNGIVEADGFGKARNFLGECRRLLHLPRGHAVVRLKHPPETSGRPVKRQNHLLGGEAAADFCRRRHGWEVDRCGIAAGGNLGHHLAAGQCQLCVRLPVGRCARQRHNGRLLRIPVGLAVGSIPGLSQHGRGEDGAESGRVVERTSQIGVHGQECRAAGCFGPGQRIGVGSEELLDRCAAAALRLHGQPASAVSGLSCHQRGIVAAAGGNADPRFEGIVSGSGHGGKRADGIGGEVTRGRVAQEFCKQSIGLTIRKKARTSHDEFHEPLRLKQPRRAGSRDPQRTF